MLLLLLLLPMDLVVVFFGPLQLVSNNNVNAPRVVVIEH